MSRKKEDMESGHSGQWGARDGGIDNPSRVAKERASGRAAQVCIA
jgi:hypothetical protein